MPQAKVKKGQDKAEKTGFDVGDYVVYPMHGVGQINAVQKQEILGKKTKCYILDITASKMKVMIPVDKADTIGIRPIIKKKAVS